MLTPQHLINHFINDYEVERIWAPANEISLTVPLLEFIKFLYMNNYHLGGFSIYEGGKLNAGMQNNGSYKNFEKAKKRLAKLARILFQEQAQPAPMYEITQFENRQYDEENVEMPTFIGYDAKHPERPYFTIRLNTVSSQVGTNIMAVEMNIYWFVNNKHGMAKYDNMSLLFAPTTRINPADEIGEVIFEFNQRFAKYGFHFINYIHRNHLPRFLFD